MNAKLEQGWLEVPYNGPALARVELAVGARPAPEDWRPAYHDRPRGVVKIRPLVLGPGLTKVWIRVEGVVSGAGTILGG